MLKERKRVDLGGFGSSRIAGPRKSPIRRLISLVLLLALLALLPSAYDGWSALYINFLERDLPSISVGTPPVGIGIEPGTITFEVGDEGAGLYEVIVRGEQDNQVKDILKKQYTGEKVRHDTIRVMLAGRESGFHEGDFRLIVTVFDRSFWTSVRTTTIDLVADYSKPKLEVITTQHNAVVGGAELVFYRVYEQKEFFSGVTDGRGLYPGFQAKKLDPEFESVPDVYFTLFPIPVDFDLKQSTIKVFARDNVGNTATEGIYYRIQPVSYPKQKMELTEEFIKGKVDQLLRGYIELEAKLGSHPQQELPVPASDADYVRYFRLINEDYRVLLERSLVTIFSRPKMQKLWSGSFARNLGTAKAPFGEQRAYTYHGLDAGSSAHLGVDLASTALMPITASNSGTVIFADDLGIYGKSIILDHGFGLYTLYGHLSSLQCSEGDSIQRGQVLGRSGMTGLAGGDHLHFEVRLHGVPVRPIEWWDEKWIRDHIDQKITDVKKQLGLRISVPLR